MSPSAAKRRANEALRRSETEGVEIWLSDKRVIARFAAPLDRELSAR